MPFGTSEEVAYYAQVCRENGTLCRRHTDKQGNGFLAFARRRMLRPSQGMPRNLRT